MLSETMAAWVLLTMLETVRLRAVSRATTAAKATGEGAGEVRLAQRVHDQLHQIEGGQRQQPLQDQEHGRGGGLGPKRCEAYPSSSARPPWASAELSVCSGTAHRHDGGSLINVAGDSVIALALLAS